MGSTLIFLLVLVVVVLVCLWLIGKLGADAQLQMIMRIVVVGFALIIVFVKYLLPLLP